MRFGGLAADASTMGNLLDGMPELLMPECPAAVVEQAAELPSQMLVDAAATSQYACSGHGVCALGQCLCDEGFAGLRCEIRCEAGWGGYMCTEPACPCEERGTTPPTAALGTCGRICQSP